MNFLIIVLLQWSLLIIDILQERYDGTYVSIDSGISVILHNQDGWRKDVVTDGRGAIEIYVRPSETITISYVDGYRECNVKDIPITDRFVQALVKCTRTQSTFLPIVEK